MLFTAAYSKTKHIEPVKELLTSEGDFEILREVVTPGADGMEAPFEPDEVIIWIKNTKTGKEEKLFKTIKPAWGGWCMGDDDHFYPISIDSIPAVTSATIYQHEPLQIIVSGCPDWRNELAFFIEVPSRKAWFVPANKGFLGLTEDLNMIFHSYRYNSKLGLGGRYSFIQIFDENGQMVDSLNLEHIDLAIFNDLEGEEDFDNE